METELMNQHQDWEEVRLHGSLLQLVGRLTARMFVPEELSKNPVWVRV